MNTWSYISGKIKTGEEVFVAIIREINEELGLKIDPKRIVGNFTHQYSFAKINLTLIACELNGSKKIISDGSHTDFKWVTLGDITKDDFAPLDSKIVEYLELHTN